MGASRKFNQNNEGWSILVVLVLILILGVIGYAFISLTATHQYSIPQTVQTMQVFYIAQGGLEAGKKYASDWYRIPENKDLFPDWAPYTRLTGISLGSGAFDLEIHWETDGTRFVTFTANAGL